jgi:hypothetical protein
VRGAGADEQRALLRGGASWVSVADHALPVALTFRSSTRTPGESASFEQRLVAV